MWITLAILLFVSLERLAELALAARNTRRLVAQGAREYGAAHYPLIVALHAVWLAGLWLFAWDRPLNAAALAAFIVLQALRIWVLLTLGSRWTTRILVLSGEELVTRGPYRFVRHPNYLVVIGEIAILPLVFGMTWYAALFSILNAAVLLVRIRCENEALRIEGARHG